MDIIVIIIVCIIAFFVLRYIVNRIGIFVKSKMAKERFAKYNRIDENTKSLQEQYGVKTVDDCNRKLVQLISSDFAKNGWEKWDDTIHESAGQLDRLKKATVYGDSMHVVQFNPLIGIAKIKGSSGNYYLTSGKRCSCPDYRYRLKPCKHMYKLSMFLTDEDVRLETDLSVRGSYSHDNVLGELHFSIVGQNQKAVKDFIVDHSGIYGDFGWNRISAVVLASDSMTERRAEAIARDVEILTFEQLQNLFDIFVDGNDINIEETMN